MRDTIKTTVEIHMLDLAFMLDELESLKLTNTKTYHELKQKFDYLKAVKKDNTRK